jgi:predicted ATPase/class 3 adenylate cyclase
VKVPSGLVTLLFTDIEGSTSAWESSPNEMQTALARHDEIVRGLIESSNGYVFATAGDAFCAAFMFASDALLVAAQIQRQIAAESWSESAEIKVRVALHSGTCLERDKNYFGPTVNRVARILSTAYGGQVLCSEATVALIDDDPPSGMSFLDLGEHRLKDLATAVQIYQVRTEDLRTDFPPIRSLDNPDLRHNLPYQASSFVGRGRELEHVRALLTGARIVTLSGTGGVGKTRLALHIAAEMLDGTGDGVWFVDLSPLSEPSLVAESTADVFGIRETTGTPLVESLCDFLRDKRLLLVFDNCEHVIGDAAKVIQRLIEACPLLVVLATSREPLRVMGEHLYRVPSLSLPSSESSESLTDESSEAVLLFLERAAQQRAGFTIDTEDAQAIARLCVRLDGLPFAIELATARLRTLSVSDIEARLDQRFTLLTSGRRTALPRHQTLQAMIDWSYELLTPPEKSVLSRLSVFAGGFDLEAAEAVAQGSEVDDLSAVNHLSSLVDKSLVQAEGTDRIRYRLLETVRQYAEKRLEQSGEGDEVRRAHRDHFLALAESAYSLLIGPEQATWYRRLDFELGNLRLAFAFSLTDDPEPGLRLSFALHTFFGHGMVVEGARTIRAQLDRPESKQPTVIRGKALTGAAYLLGLVLGDHSVARQYLTEALAIGRAESDHFLIAQTFRLLAGISQIEGDLEAAVAYAEDGLRAAELLPFTNLNAALRAALHSERAMALVDAGRDGRGDYATCLELFVQLGNRLSVAFTLINISNMEIDDGDMAGARSHLQESLDISHDLGNKTGIVFSLNSLGLLEYLERNYEVSAEMRTESLKLAVELGHQPLMAAGVMGLAQVRSATGDHMIAARLHGAADAMYENFGGTTTGEEGRTSREDLTFLRRELGDVVFEEAFEEGRHLTLEQSVAMATAHD